MSYSVNGKVYTDHPLMDEIVYNCKEILKTIVIKNDVLANISETEETVNNAENFFIMKTDGYIPFEYFSFTAEILEAYGYDSSLIRYYLENKYNIPESDRESLTAFANTWFKTNFEEKNNYYRTLMGLPPYGTGEMYYIYLDNSYIPSNYTNPLGFDIRTTPLHMYASYNMDLVTILYNEGVMDRIREEYRGSSYSYISYLGYRAIDLYTARKAAKWDILYMPNVQYMVEDRFTELYKTNRDIYLNRSYQDFYQQTGEYYDQMMILCVLAQTFADLITEVPEWYIRRDIFDIRSCKYFLESYGVKFFREIPLRYQISIVKNINKLIKYKSSNKNFDDIINIFGIDNISIFKYWLYKKQDIDTKSYDLEFISSDVNESYDNYIRDTKYRATYDYITLQDQYWDGEMSHSYVKNSILNEDFTIRGTKYMSIEYNVSLEEYLYQMEYMLGLLLDSNISTDITVGIPSIDLNTQFKISDLFLFLVVCSNTFYQTDTGEAANVTRYKRVSQGAGPGDIDEDHYNWKVKYFPELYTPKYGRVFGFNTNLDKDALIRDLEKRHSHYAFGRNNPGVATDTDATYKNRSHEWIDEMGVYDFIVPGGSYTSVDDIINVYRNNTRCYEKLMDLINNADNQDDKKIYEYVFQELYTRDFDTTYYLLSDMITKSNNLVELLRDKNYVLYNTYNQIVSENDNLDTRQDLFKAVINDVICTLEYYFTGEGLEYLFAFTANQSFESIVNYLYLMINFFKSYKVRFLDPYVTFIAGNDKNKMENSAKPIDVVNEFRYEYLKWDRAFTDDCIEGFNFDYLFKDYAFDAKSERDMVDMYAHYEPDPFDDQNYDGKGAEDSSEPYKDLDGGCADENLNMPYFMVNGGSSYLGKINFSDIDGGEADELGREYFEIDGGTAYDPDSMRKDAMGRQMFNYIIDGGGAAKRDFYTNTLHMYLIGTEILADATVSPRASHITYDDNGLYLPSATYASLARFNVLEEDINNSQEITTTTLNKFMEDYKIISNENLLIGRIQDVVNSVLYNMEYALKMMNNNTFVRYIDGAVDDLREAFEDEIVDNPYAWESLD